MLDSWEIDTIKIDEYKVRSVSENGNVISFFLRVINYSCNKRDLLAFNLFEYARAVWYRIPFSNDNTKLGAFRLYPAAELKRVYSLETRLGLRKPGNYLNDF